MFSKLFILVLGLFLAFGQAPVFCELTTTASGLPTINANNVTAATEIFVYRKGVMLNMVDLANGIIRKFAGGEIFKQLRYAPIDLSATQPIELDNIATTRIAGDTVTLQGFSYLDLWRANLNSPIADAIRTAMGLSATGRRNVLTEEMLIQLKETAARGLANFPKFIDGNDVETEYTYENGQLVEEKTAVQDENGNIIAGIFNKVKYKFGEKVGEENYKIKFSDTSANFESAGFEKVSSFFQNGQLKYEVTEATNNVGVSQGISEITVYDSFGREIERYKPTDINAPPTMPLSPTTDLIAAILIDPAKVKKSSVTEYDDILGVNFKRHKTQEIGGDGTVLNTTFYVYDADNGRLAKELKYNGDWDFMPSKTLLLSVTEHHYTKMGTRYFDDVDDLGPNPSQTRTYFQFGQPIARFSRVPPKDPATSIDPARGTTEQTSGDMLQQGRLGAGGTFRARAQDGGIITYSSQEWVFAGNNVGYQLTIDAQKAELGANLYTGIAAVLLHSLGDLTWNGTQYIAHDGSATTASAMIQALADKIKSYNDNGNTTVGYVVQIRIESLNGRHIVEPTTY